MNSSTTPGDQGPHVRCTVLADRMPPIPPDEMTAEQKQVAAEIAAGPRGRIEGPYWPILRSPGFAACIQHVGAYFRYRCTLDRKISEMAALMAARAWSQQFVWDVHILQALDAGLAREAAMALAEGRRPQDMEADEAALWDFVTELLVNKGVSDATYDRTVRQFGESGVIDILGVVGYYSTLSMIMNVGRTGMLDGRPFPLDALPLRLHAESADPLRG